MKIVLSVNKLINGPFCKNYLPLTNLLCTVALLTPKNLAQSLKELNVDKIFLFCLTTNWMPWPLLDTVLRYLFNDLIYVFPYLIS